MTIFRFNEVNIYNTISAFSPSTVNEQTEYLLADIIDVPERMKVLTASGKNLTDACKDTFTRWTTFLHATLRKEDNPRADYPTPHHKKFYELFTHPDTPVFNTILSQHLLTIAQEIEQTGMMLDKDRRIHDEQFAKLVWAALILPQGKKSPRKVHVDGEAGSGKTAVIGCFGDALSRMAIQGDIRGNFMYVMQKGPHVNQQMYGHDMRKRRLRREYPFEVRVKDFNKARTFAIQLCGEENAKKFFPFLTCKKLLKANLHTPAHVRTAIINCFDDQGQSLETFQQSVPHADHILEILSQYFANLGPILRIKKDRYMFYPIKEHKESMLDEEDGVLTGDFGGRIPQEFDDIGLIYTPKTLGFKHTKNDDPHMKDESATSTHAIDHDTVTISDDNYRLGIFLRRHIYLDKVAKSHWEFLKDTEAMLIDEGEQVSGGEWESYLNNLRAQHNAKARDLFIAAARAPRYNDAFLPDWDVHSPKAPLSMLINENVLASIALRYFPGINEERFPAGSPEALNQLVDDHFCEIPFYNKIGQIQRAEADGQFVVGSRAVDDLVDSLLKRIKELKLNARVLAYNYNTSPDASSDVQGLILEEREYPLWIVSSPPPIAKALSWPKLQFMTISMATLSAKRASELAQRLQHSDFHRKKGVNKYRTLFNQHIVTETDSNQLLYHALTQGEERPDKDTISIVPGAAILSIEKRMQDQRIIKKDPEKYPEVQIPASYKAARDRDAIEKKVTRKTQVRKTGTSAKEKGGVKTPPRKNSSSPRTDVTPPSPVVDNPSQNVAPPAMHTPQTTVPTPKIVEPMEDLTPDRDSPIEEILEGPFNESDKVDAILREVASDLNALPEVIRFNWTYWKTYLGSRARGLIHSPQKALEYVRQEINRHW